MSDNLLSDSSIEIIHKGWKSPILEITHRSVFCFCSANNLTVEISLESILKDLIIPPQPDHIMTLWEIYNPDESIPSEIVNCLDRKEAKPSWKKIAKILKNTSCERLYQIASQNAYRLEYVCDHENQKILQNYNNILVECLVDKWINPPQVDLELKALFDRQSISFNCFRLLGTILEYYRLMLPYPYRLREHPEVFADYTKYDAPEEVKQRYHDEVFSRENRLKERFAFYKYCKAAIYSLYLQMDEKSKQEFDSIHDRSNIENGTDYERGHAARVSRPRNSFVNLLPMMERAGNLFQCPFCYRFSSKGLPKGPNQFPQLCDRPECKKAHENWSKHIRGAGFSSENKT
jgi:hypothetical protein